MAFTRITSPHMHQPLDTAAVMRWVLLATVPGILALTWFFGFGTITNLLIACASALAFEAFALSLRKRPLKFYLGDNSALVTAFLLAIALPPAAPWWLIVIGTACAILLAKHLYGGLGYNPFNPAMVGYVVLLISFPVEMTQWLAPRGAGTEVMGVLEAFRAAFGLLPEARLDGFTMATPLDLVKQNRSLTLNELTAQNPQFGGFAGLGWEWVNLAFLAGGGLLLYKKIFTWHAPVSMLLALALLSGIFYGGEAAGSAGSPLFHLFSGATMLGAFFIVTDPVTSAVSTRGRIVYGAAIGVLLYIIRCWGNYPDAIAFAVLLMNFAAPLVDYYTQPRVYGHSRGGPKGGARS